MPGAAITRSAVAALVRLEPLSGGSIRPHEQTFSAAKADRLELFKASQANFSPIFSIYPDPADRVVSLLKGARPDSPLMDFKDTLGYVAAPLPDHRCRGGQRGAPGLFGDAAVYR